MALKYTVLGAGAMGLRFGILLQELAGAKVDFVDNWDPQVETIKQQGGVYVSRDHENRRLVPINIYSPEEYDGDPDVLLVLHGIPDRPVQFHPQRRSVRCGSFRLQQDDGDEHILDHSQHVAGERTGGLRL